MSKLLAVDHTDSATFNPSNSASPQVLRTDTLPSNPYGYVEAIWTVSVEQTGTSAAQTLTINATVNGNIVEAYTFKTYAVLKYDIIDFSAVAPAKEGGVVKLELAQAAGNDAQTSIIVKKTIVKGHN